MTNEEVLEKIIKQSQMTALIANVETKAISAKQLIDDLKSYQVWMEMQWEMYYQESKLNTINTLAILKKDAEIIALKKEVEKLINTINAD